jgi:hypothetical protein
MVKPAKPLALARHFRLSLSLTAGLVGQDDVLERLYSLLGELDGPPVLSDRLFDFRHRNVTLRATMVARSPVALRWQ